MTAAERLAEQLLAAVAEYEAARATDPTSGSIDERLAEAGRIRRQAQAIEEQLPALMAEAYERGGSIGKGLRVSDIARRLDLTESYVYRKIREHNAQQ